MTWKGKELKTFGSMLSTNEIYILIKIMLLCKQKHYLKLKCFVGQSVSSYKLSEAFYNKLTTSIKFCYAA